MSNRREYQPCKFCHLLFMPVDFLIYRQKGYCTEGCMAHEARTPISNADIAYKNGLAVRNPK